MQAVKPKRKTKKSTGKKRAPSKYNLFMKECIPKTKAINPDVPHTEIFTACAKKYKDVKGG